MIIIVNYCKLLLNNIYIYNYIYIYIYIYVYYIAWFRGLYAKYKPGGERYINENSRAARFIFCILTDEPCYIKYISYKHLFTCELKSPFLTHLLSCFHEHAHGIKKYKPVLRVIYKI